MANHHHLVYQVYLNIIPVHDLYRNQWLADKTIFNAINTHSPHLKKSFDFTLKMLNTVLAKKAGAFDESNTSGIYFTKFKTSCPYDGNRRLVSYYYYHSGKTKRPSQPSQASEIVDVHTTSYAAQNGRVRACTATQNNIDVNAIEALLKRTRNNTAPTPKRSTSDNTNNNANGNVSNEVTPPRGANQNNNPSSTQGGEVDVDGGGENTNEALPPPINAPAEQQQIPVYWYSSEAAKLFGFPYGEGSANVIVYTALEEKIALLEKVINTPDGYKLVVTHSDERFSAYNKNIIHMKCVYLRNAYRIALDKMGLGNKWIEDCCNVAVTKVNGVGYNTTISGRTVANWNIQFRTSGKFPHPNHWIANGLKPKPRIFELFPAMAADATNFVLNNLGNFNVEMLKDHLNNELIPSYKKEAEKDIQKNDLDETSDEYQLLCQYSEKGPSYSTVVRWVHYLGFKRGKTGKSYYVDGHEHEAQKQHRSKFTNTYLTELEPCTHRWVQMSIEIFEGIQESLGDDRILHKGYRYKCPETANDMIEFHVDDHERLQTYANETLKCPFGGNLSVRMPENSKPLIILGQDESVFSQFTFNSMQWIAPSGKRKLLPKSSGQAMMISAFTSREFGWGMDLSDDELTKINEKRKGEDYFDKDAALEVHKTTKKKPLTSSPFVCKFEFGGSNGYWNGNHMTMQVEDIMDCLKVIYEDKYEFAFLFDHSSGHAKKRVDGLDVSKINKSWGGKHTLRPSKIERKEGYLGEYWDPNNPQMVKIGQEQALMWDRAGEVARGPFELESEELREASRHDRSVPIPEEEQKEVPKIKAELVKDLLRTEYGRQEGETSLQKKLLKNLKDAAEGLGIATKKKPATKVVHGFEGKCKGLLQILYERGYINLAMLERYRKKAVDGDGNLIPEFSLVHLMENCADFYNEECQLQFVCRNVGARAIITTKYHAEYAGEGIEYAWGASKAKYRRHPIEAKKGKANFLKLLDYCISRGVLTTDLMRKYSKRARSYMCVYKDLEMRELHEQTEGDNEITYNKIESMKKIYKAHRAALDFDKSFIMKSITADDFNYEEEVECPKKKKRKRGV